MAAVLLLVVCVLLTRSLWAPGQDGAARANVLALPVGVLSLFASIVSGWFAWRALKPAPQLREVARDLRDAVRQDRERFMTQALGAPFTIEPARVVFADPEHEALPAQAEALLLNWQDVDGGEAGSLDDVADFYRRLPSGRLVVLGAPGAGKTVLLTRLVLDLARELTLPTEGDLPDRFRVPVLFNLSSCDLRGDTATSPGKAASSFSGWLIGQLSENYGLSVSRATELMRRGHVLPVLDGLDEMDAGSGLDGDPGEVRPRAAALLDVLNSERSLPVVLACRELEYGEVTGDGGRRLLVDARHVTLRPLTAADVVTYLVGRFGGRSRALPSRWEPVAVALGAGEPILVAMANPWQLFLAVTAYGDDNSEPGEMLAMTVPALEEHLLTRLVPATVELHRAGDAHGWTADDVTSWFTHIARNQQELAAGRGGALTDIRLPDLWSVAGRRHPQWTPTAVVVVTGLATTALFAWSALWYGTWSGAVTMWMITVGMAVVTTMMAWIALDPDPPLTRLEVPMINNRSGRQRFSRELRRSARRGLSSGAALTVILTVGFGLGLGLGATGGISFAVVLTLLTQMYAMSGELGAAATPSRLVRQCLTYTGASAVVMAITVTLPIMLVFGTLLGNWGSGVVVGLPGSVGLLLGLGFGNGATWARYGLGVRSAARRHLLPRRPARFLDWCVTVGLMRMAGNEIQFRHQQLQEWLIRRAERSSAAPPTG